PARRRVNKSPQSSLGILPKSSYSENIMSLLSWLGPAPEIPRLPDAEVRRRYPKFRWQILEATFLGYATYYLLRNNLGVVSKDIMSALHYDKDMIGSMMAATALSYGAGKFILGALSDRSNPRIFMALG